ncbi:MAG: phage late control D family protein, partial [Firmicutes bacterium]|nr:phage late control D family protein [Bacillota bacterium]
GHGIRVECADVRCAMMNGRMFSGATEKTLELATKSILEKGPYKALYGKLDMAQPEAAKENDFEIQLTCESDFDFVTRAAKKLGYEFIMIQDTLIFRKNRGTNTDPIVKLGPGKGIIDINLRRTLGGMVKEVEVLNSDDAKGEVIIGEAKASEKWSAGSSANDIIKEQKRVVIDPSVRNKEEAKKRAGSELDSIIWNYGVVQATCVGIPELTPGRFIEFENVAKNAIDGKYYITRVKHILEAGKGFKSVVEAKTNKIG